MTSQRKEQIIAAVLQYIAMALIINTTAAILNGWQNTAVFCMGAVQAFCINTVAGFLIPIEKIGNALVHLMHADIDSREALILRIFAANAIFVTIISFCMALLENGFAANILACWWRSYPILHLAGFTASLLLEVPVRILAKRFAGEKHNAENIEKTL